MIIPDYLKSRQSKNNAFCNKNQFKQEHLSGFKNLTGVNFTQKKASQN